MLLWLASSTLHVKFLPRRATRNTHSLLPPPPDTSTTSLPFLLAQRTTTVHHGSFSSPLFSRPWMERRVPSRQPGKTYLFEVDGEQTRERRVICTRAMPLCFPLGDRPGVRTHPRSQRGNRWVDRSCRRLSHGSRRRVLRENLSTRILDREKTTHTPRGLFLRESRVVESRSVRFCERLVHVLGRGGRKREGEI